MERLKKNSEFNEVYKKGKSYAEGPIVLIVRKRSGSTVRVGYSISKKVGNSVFRNLFRRRMKEIVRQLAPNLEGGRDLVFVARSSAKDADFWRLREATIKALKRSGSLKNVPQDSE